MSSKNNFLWTIALVFIIQASCKKKSSSEDSGEDSSALVITENLSEPAKALTVAKESIGSAMDTGITDEMVSSLALPLAGEGLNIDDCTEHAEPKARDGDDESVKDDGGRLRLAHPRMPLQDLYCKMQKDTGAPDSFLGALSSGDMLFCLIGDQLTFDGEEREKTLNRDEILACISDDLDEQAKQETIEEIGDKVTGKVVASAPPVFGDKKTWDASIEFTVELAGSKEVLKILLKDSDDVLAMANLNASGRAESVDAYVVAINKKKGEVRYEAKFQRIRTPDGTSSNGWNRHAVAYVKGEFDEDLIFKDVDVAEGAYSDISVNAGEVVGEEADSPVQTGSAWTVKGSSDEGFKSYSYELNCTWDGSIYSCLDPNLTESWDSTDGSGACNGALSGTTCSGTGIEVDSNKKTVFFMDLNHDDFQKSEDWFGDLAVPDFETVQLDNDQ